VHLLTLYSLLAILAGIWQICVIVRLTDTKIDATAQRMISLALPGIVQSAMFVMAATKMHGYIAVSGLLVTALYNIGCVLHYARKYKESIYWSHLKVSGNIALIALFIGLALNCLFAAF
jgi:hypothetical protein